MREPRTAICVSETAEDARNAAPLTAGQLLESCSADEKQRPKSQHSRAYFTAAEAAEYIRSSTSTLAKLRCYGGGPQFLQIGRKIVYPRMALDEWLALRLRNSTSEYK